MDLMQEQAEDWWEVEALFDLCFAPGREALSSYRLREDVPPIAPLCFVARENQILSGAIRVWPILVSGQAAALIGPVAVHPTSQGEGLGGMMIREVIREAGKIDRSRLMLVGDAPYYGKFGFHVLRDVTMPPPTNPDRVLGVGDWSGVCGMVSPARPTGSAAPDQES